MICIYHNRDLDGFTSGAIVKRKFPDCQMIGYDYGDKLDLQIFSGQKVIMVDVSLPMAQMLEIARLSNWSFTWIDHHVSAINEYKAFIGQGEAFCSAVLDSTKAACELTWQHYFRNDELPYAVQLLGEYDTWRNADEDHWSQEVLPFQFGMRVYCNSVETFPNYLFEKTRNSNSVASVINTGMDILQYQASVSALNCKKAAFEYEFEGLRAICLNVVGANMDTFKSVYDESKHDLMLVFFLDGKKWTVSLYTSKDSINCSEVAKLRGGGGHKKAAGFTAAHLSEVFNRLIV